MLQRGRSYKLFLTETATTQIGAVDIGTPVTTFEPDGLNLTVWHNFDQGLLDSSTFENHCYHEFTKDQVKFVEDKDTTFGFAIEFNGAVHESKSNS